MTAMTAAIRNEMADVMKRLAVMPAKNGRAASATAIGIFLALGFVEADLSYFQGDAIIKTPNTTYRFLEGLWQRETHPFTYVSVTLAAEAAALDLFMQQSRDQYIVLAFTKDDLEVVATAYVMTKTRHLSR